MDNCNKESVLYRIKEFREYLAISKRSLAASIGVSQTTLNNQFIGKRGLSLDILIALLSSFPELSSEWLIRGVGEMIKPNQDGESSVGMITIEEAEKIIKNKDDVINLLLDKIRELEK